MSPAEVPPTTNPENHVTQNYLAEQKHTVKCPKCGKPVAVSFRLDAEALRIQPNPAAFLATETEAWLRAARGAATLQCPKHKAAA